MSGPGGRGRPGKPGRPDPAHGSSSSKVVPVLTAFHAPWSGPSRLLLGILPELARSLAGRVDVEVVDVTTPEGRARARAADVTRVPTCVVSGPDGREAARLVGARPKDEVRRLAEEAATMGA